MQLLLPYMLPIRFATFHFTITFFFTSAVFKSYTGLLSRICSVFSIFRDCQV